MEGHGAMDSELFDEISVSSLDSNELSHLISQVLDMIRSLLRIYIIEPSPDYAHASSLASFITWFLFKVTLKTVLQTVSMKTKKVYLINFI